jgi:ABC-type multidrug transport system fused ATPase/permease subunit
MDFGEVLSSAWKIIWKHKVLWIFGILASCGSANGSIGNFGNNFRWTVSAPVDDYFYQIERIPEWQIILAIVVMLIAVLLLALLVIFLATIGRIGMIRGTQQANAGIDRLVFGELLSGSMPFFWRVFGLNLLVGLAIVYLRAIQYCHCGRKCRYTGRFTAWLGCGEI